MTLKNVSTILFFLYNFSHSSVLIVLSDTHKHTCCFTADNSLVVLLFFFFWNTNTSIHDSVCSVSIVISLITQQTRAVTCIASDGESDSERTERRRRRQLGSARLSNAIAHEKGENDE